MSVTKEVPLDTLNGKRIKIIEKLGFYTLTIETDEGFYQFDYSTIPSTLRKVGSKEGEHDG